MSNRELEELFDFDPTCSTLKNEVMQVILQHLVEEGYTSTVQTLQAEAQVNNFHKETRSRAVSRKICAFITSGEWEEANRIALSKNFKVLKKLQYEIFKQQFLEQVDSGQSMAAVKMLTMKLKPVEAQAPAGEFQMLTYVLSCSSVKEAPSGYFDGWSKEGGRKQLVKLCKSFLEPDDTLSSLSIPPNRLWTLIRQATAWQVKHQSAMTASLEKPQIQSVTRDYEAPICPNVERMIFRNHSSVKCAGWVRDGDAIACGLADGTVCIWDVEHTLPQDGGADAEPALVDPSEATQLLGHEGRVWTVTDLTAKRAATGGADGTVRVWDVSGQDAGSSASPCLAVMNAHSGDVYAVAKHPSGTHIASGGFDCTVKLFDVEKETELQSFVAGHARPVTAVRFNNYGNLLFTGSKDGTVKVWEVASGACLQAIQREHTKSAVSAIDLSPDGSTLLVGYQVRCARTLSSSCRVLLSFFRAGLFRPLVGSCGFR